MSESPLRARLLTSADELEALAGPWRELAHACRCPAALPGWQLAWWRHLAPEGALLRTAAVFEQESLVGLAPFYVRPGLLARYSLLGAGATHRVTPLALPGQEREVANLVASALAAAEPRLDLLALDAVDAGSPWPEAIQDCWTGRARPRRYTTAVAPAPVLELSNETFLAWFSSRSKKFREEMRRAKRRLEGAGGHIVLASEGQEVGRAIDEFLRLHLARRSARGGSSLSSRWAPMLKEAALELIPRGEMRLWVVEVEGRIAAVNVMLAAGGVLAGFNIGIDEDYVRLEPGHLTSLAAIEDAFERGEVRVDTGGGDSPYKRRLTGDDLPLAWILLVPRGRRYPLALTSLAGGKTHQLAAKLAERLPDTRRAQLKRVLRKR